MEVAVLRLSHRAERDKRVTTHLGLVARALGASKLMVTGLKDEHLADSIRRVVDSWGGQFEVEFVSSWKSVLAKYKKLGYTTVHLTMYGLPVQDNIKQISKSKKVLAIVGGEKVPFEVYQETDFNIAVTSQPHSEISALAVFLDRLFAGKELEKSFSGAMREIVPQKCGKKILEK
jgi:tRNA (cytidine56-2'-O)-methyltransferase